MIRRFESVHKKTGKGWLNCDICGLHKPDVQFRRKHQKGKWVCGDCYDKAIISDATFVDRLRETKPQWKRRKREEKQGVK